MNLNVFETRINRRLDDLAEAIEEANLKLDDSTLAAALNDTFEDVQGVINQYLDNAYETIEEDEG